jgi:hypothetical protein
LCLKVLKEHGQLSINKLYEHMKELGYPGNREKLTKQLSTWDAIGAVILASQGKGKPTLVDLGEGINP